MDLLNPFFVNQTKYIKKTVASCDATGGITLGTKLKMPIFTRYLPQAKLLKEMQLQFLGFENLWKEGGRE